ncbi:MAG: type II secretion system F family protein [Eggerthellaceae bacterium]|nr:type II secretion system F family protein [Eggerthellaceae bacterium]
MSMSIPLLFGSIFSGLSCFAFVLSFQDWLRVSLLGARCFDGINLKTNYRTDRPFSKKRALLSDVKSLIRFLLRNGIEIFRPVSMRLAHVKPIESFLISCKFLLQAKSLETDNNFLFECLFALLCCIMVASFVIFRSIITACAIASCVVCVTYVVVKTKQEIYTSRVKQDLPEALRILASACNASLSLPQAFEAVVHELKGPLHKTFMNVVDDIHLGYSVSDALQRLQKRSALPELAFLAVALDVQYVAGGSLVEVIKQAQEAIDKSIKLQRDLRVQTSQARLSARVVSVMPLIILGALSIISPSFIKPLISSPAGFGVLCVALLLEVIGILMVRRILDIPEAHI